MNDCEAYFDLSRRIPDVRRVADMIEVILDQRWANQNRNTALYYMYRDLGRTEDREKIIAHALRYDITVIPPLIMGKEFVKTKGHYHPECAPSVTYPEIYEIQEGKAHFLLQRTTKGRVDDVVMVEAKKGDKVIVPPNYGHVTINPGRDTLQLANWVCRNFASLYEEYTKKRGAAYYELSDGTLLPNPNYGELPKIRRAKPTEVPELGIERGRALYSLIENPEQLAFLIRPQNFMWVFERAF